MSASHLITAELTRQSAVESRHPELPRDKGGSVLLGESMVVHRLRSQIRRIAPHFRIALIHGEAGVGKQLVARAIHGLSPSAEGPFVVAHASALAEAVAEAKHPRAITGEPSLLEAAEGGTLYLKRMGELSFAQQDALFRFLCHRWERRMAPPQAGPRIDYHQEERRRDIRYAGIRILAASDRDLSTLAAIGQFRQDLYAQLSAVEILVPPLRQRAEDIPVLAVSLLRHLAEQTGQSSKLLADATLLDLRERQWPNNIRELEQIMTHAAALAEGGLIEPRHLPMPAKPPLHSSVSVDSTRIDRLQDVIERHVLEVLTRCGGNKLRAAELLGISRSTLYRMLGSKSDSIRLLPQ